MARILYSGVNEHGQPSEVMLGCAIGDIIPHFGTTPPPGTLVCDGSEVSREAYAELYEEIGSLVGQGDGSTTFNLPDLRDKWVVGSGTLFANGATIEASLPEIFGSIGSAQIIVGNTPSHAVNYVPQGALSLRTYAAVGTSPVQGLSGVNQTQSYTIELRASDYNDVYGKHESWEVVPASVAVLPCIVYE